VISLIQAILSSEIKGRDENEKSFIIIQWLLFSRCLASGDGAKTLNDVDSDFSVPGLIERTRFIARLGASDALQYSNPPRWQLRCVSANVASVAMMMLLSMDKGTDGCGFLFNSKSAQSRCTAMLRKENKEYGFELHSHPIFHLEELVTTACSTSTSTSNHSELPSVQISGLRLLISLFRAFGSQLDATTNDGTSVLEQYSSQIISAVKHALNSESLLNESVPGTAFHRLFSTGCEALFVMISEQLISDPIAMRRLLQPVLLAATETPIVPFPTGDENDSALWMSSSHITDDSRSYPLFRLSKLCFLSKASMLIALGEVHIEQSKLSIVATELGKEETGRAIHCAAAAIDGFLLQDSQQSPSNDTTSRPGLTYKNTTDLDGSVREALIENWPMLSASAISSIIKAVKAGDSESEERKSLQAWLRKLTPLVVTGLRNSLSSLHLSGMKPSSEHSSASQTAALCVYAVRLLVRDSDCVGEGLCPNELGDIANIVTESVIFHVLESKRSLSQDDEILVQQSCGLIAQLCKQCYAIGVDAAILTRAVVTPLVTLQEKREMEPNHGIIISSCIRSSQSLLQSHPGEGRAELEKALVQLVLALLTDEPEEEIKAACLSLLQACCQETTMSHEEWGQIANYSATHALWDAWAVVCMSLPSGYGIKFSIDAIKMQLQDLQSGPRHAAALVALRSALNSAIAEDSSLLSYVLQSVGFEILQLLRAHGVRVLSGPGFDENRVTVCAESVKVNLMALQYLISASKEEDKSVSFISALFEILVESISFNGLPNHPSGKKGADETIGRMCAQVFVHVVRTAPMLFKSTMVAISSESRAVLESAVRADMSGYAAPKRETKKKISLKGFVR